MLQSGDEKLFRVIFSTWINARVLLSQSYYRKPFQSRLFAVRISFYTSIDPYTRNIDIDSKKKKSTPAAPSLVSISSDTIIPFVRLRAYILYTQNWV